jgi:hypothetical protein
MDKSRSRVAWGVMLILGVFLCTTCKKAPQNPTEEVSNKKALAEDTLEIPTSWEKSFGGKDLDAGNCVRQTADGGYIVVGATKPSNKKEDIYLVKTNAKGEIVWAKTYGIEDFDLGISVLATPDGGYIVGAQIISYPEDGGVKLSVHIIKTDSEGEAVWTRTYDGRGGGLLGIPDGGYVVAAGSRDSVSLIKINDKGNTLWSRTYPWIDESSNSVYKTTDGGFIIVGHVYVDSSLVQLLKINSQGDMLWRKLYKASTDYRVPFCTASDSGYILAGEENHGIWIMKVDEAGDRLWRKTYGERDTPIGWDRALSLQQTSDGGYILAGGKDLVYNCDLATDGALYLVKLDAAGDTLWTREYGKEGGQVGNFVQETSDGGFIVAGVTTPECGENSDVYLVKTEP